MALAVATPLVAVVGYFVLQAHWSEQELAAAVAQADQLDPGWRLMELESTRKPVPAENDSAPIVSRMGNAIVAVRNTATAGKDLHELYEAMEKLHPTASPTAEQTALLRARLKPFAPAMADVPKLVDLSQGRFASNVKPTLNWSVWNADQANITNWLLESDAMLHLSDGDRDRAWRDCHAMLNVARSLGDEPVMVVQSVRAHTAGRAARLMERMLAHGVVAEAWLAETQALLEDEIKHPTLLISLRGSRAIVDHSCRLLEEGRASLAEAKRMATGSFGPPGIRDEVEAYFSRGGIKPAHAWLLRYMNQAVEIAKRPDHEAGPALVELDKTLADAPELARVLAPKFDRTGVGQRRWRAIHRCAVAALAVERYRLKDNAWPASLDDLVKAKLLGAVPVDPFDGKVLRYRALPDGVVIFSIGPDGRGNGDALDGDAPAVDVLTTGAERLEFRLWHADRRGQGR